MASARRSGPRTARSASTGPPAGSSPDRVSAGMKAVNPSIAQLRAPCERANADLKNWRILRKIRSSPTHATLLVNAIQALILKR